MAKTIMVSNEIYHNLKKLKYDRSFSELIKDLLDSGKSRKGSGLMTCFGSLKKDNEWKVVEKITKRGWKNWSKKYV